MSILDWLTQTPDASATQGATQPSALGYNGLGLIGAALQDAGSVASGRPDGGAGLAQFAQRGYAAKQMQARQALAQAMQSGDPAAAKNARAGALQAGLDPSLYMPRVMDAGGGSLVSIDPVTGQAALLARGMRPPAPGYQWSPDGMSQMPIQGGPADPTVLARRAAARRGQVPLQLPPAVPQAQPPADYSYSNQGVLRQ